MIVVKVELHSAVTREITTLSTMVITNDGTSETPLYGNYNVYVGRKSGDVSYSRLRQIVRRPMRYGRVEGHNRLRYNVWVLVAKALTAAFRKEFKAYKDE
jgi:hypothetical protein